MIRKILLLTPPYHTGIIEITGNWPPLNLVYLAGSLRQAGFELAIYDVMTLRHDLQDIEKYVAANNPDAVLIGAYTASINAALDTLAVVKKVNPSVITVLGGVHASFCFEEILRNNRAVDFVVRGEGEITAVELFRSLNESTDLTLVQGLAFLQGDRLVITGERPLIDDLDSLLPAWDLIDWNNYYYKITNRRLGLMSSSRGCPHRCSFCSQHLFWRGTYRERSPQNFVSEVEVLYKQYGVRMIMLADEYTTYNRRRWEQILDLLIEKKMDLHFSMETRVEDVLRDRDILWKYRQAGVMHVYIGVESVFQSSLDRYNKGLEAANSREAIKLLDEAGIITECSFISGNLEETPDTMQQTLQKALEFNPDLAHFLLITPWPYTPLYEELKPHIIEHDLSKYHFVYPIVKPLQMDVTELWDNLINCFRVFYMEKVKQCLALPPGFKRDYMLNSIQIMHREFFVENFGKQTIKLPEEMGYEIERLLSENMGGIDMERKKYAVDSPMVQELDRQIMEFIEKGIDNHDEETFNRLALEEFEIQFHANANYREYCLKQGKTPENVKRWDEIPAIPTQAFKEAVIASFPLEEAELALLTSGTSDPRMKGKIYRDKRSMEMIIKSNYLLTKHFVFPDVDKMRILLLVPSPKVAPAMAMAFGLNRLKETFGTEDSMYLITPEGFNAEAMVEALRKAESTGEPLALVGATSGFVYFFNYCKENNLTFKLPPKSRICDGGGYQGTFGSCTREEFYAGCEKYFGLSGEYCVNILGMSESGTNYFDNTLREKLLGLPITERHKVSLPWTRTLVVGPRTGQRLPKGEIGLIRHYDLTNRATVFAVQTDNLGYETDGGFEIVGRAGGKIPGFGLEPTSVKDWILAGHRQGAAGCSAATAGFIYSRGNHPSMPHSHPCSTVADEMLRAHSHPCSTVADEMLRAHSHPCSTVADEMLRAHSHPCSTVADEMLRAHSHLCSTVADEMIMKGKPKE
ncbi:cobalamin B12-binding domain-containing protein [Thermincola ferriacetica]|uniref:Cobalamin B12-binding domain-containing protein n=1 Tax=Thermincola ferriacetica TaxID=281456 RepID=A0A0L6W668_9FIRM|nr:B12-binding domain-containing radical SAM protein [Thermincola ferriacetica]KNZ71010.1 cobalamin B12-binding domain-containing protein [Thermincola ferriacetica]